MVRCFDAIEEDEEQEEASVIRRPWCAFFNQLYQIVRSPFTKVLQGEFFFFFAQVDCFI